MNAGRDDLQAECTKLKAEHFEDSEKPAPLPTPPARRLSRRVPSPLSVRWREFRFQILPLLAFGASLALAGGLWQKAVVPVPAETNASLLSTPGKALESDPGIPVTVPEISQTGSNGLPHLPSARD